MLSVFIIILIILIVKTTCFDNTVLMAEPKEKLPYGSWSISAHNFPNSGYSHKTFDMQLQKGLVYLYT